MLNNLFESVCVTSAININEQLYFCSPPFIYINEQRHSLNAKVIYPMLENNIAVLTLNNKIIFLNKNLETLKEYTLPQDPISIHSYGTDIVINYSFEYQICNIEEIGCLLKKNKIVSFAQSPQNKITYVIKNKQLENNQVFFDRLMDIEMGVEQIYLISPIKPHYIYQSVVLPQLTIIDLETCTELYHIEFDLILDQIFILNHNSVLVQCENHIYQIHQQKLIQYERINQIRLSCVVEFNNFQFFGSINDNSVVMSGDTIVKEYYNLGQIVDIHPCNQICYIASYNKKYPVSLFRKGINEQIVERYRLPNDQKARKIFYLNPTLVAVSFTSTTELYTIPQFFISDIGIIKNQKTLFLYQLIQGLLLQITSNKVLLIDQQNGILYVLETASKVKDCRYDEHRKILFLYLESSELQQLQILDSEIKLIRTQIIQHLSAFQIINNALHYSNWFKFELHNYENQNTYKITNIQASIISIEQTLNYILLGLTDGHLVALQAENYRYHKMFLISNTHPIKLLKYQNKVLLFSHHIYMIDNQLQQIIVNWDHLFDFSYQNDKLVGIISSEIQIVTLSTGSSSQCRELKYIKDIEVIGLRLFKDHLVVATSENQLFSFFDDQLKSSQLMNFNVEKLEQYNNIYIAGYDDQTKGRIVIVNEILQQLYNFTYVEPIYDIKLHSNQIYFNTNTAIHNTDGTFSYDFKILIKGFDLKDKYFLIYEEHKGAHLFYNDDKMIALGSLCYPCQYAAFYYEDIIGFSESEVRIAKQNLLTFMISEQLEILVSNPIQVTCVKDKFYGTLYGVLGQYE